MGGVVEADDNDKNGRNESVSYCMVRCYRYATIFLRTGTHTLIFNHLKYNHPFRVCFTVHSVVNRSTSQTKNNRSWYAAQHTRCSAQKRAKCLRLVAMRSGSAALASSA